MTAPAICGAKKKQGEGFCTQRAGWGTDHVGDGRCKLHGGRNPIKHGRYSTVNRTRLGKLVEAHLADPDPLNMLPELATMRALLETWLAKHGEEPDPDVLRVLPLLEGISKAVKRVQDAQADGYIGRGDFLRIMMEMGRVVDAVLGDEKIPARDKAAAIRRGWRAIRVA